MCGDKTLQNHITITLWDFDHVGSNERIATCTADFRDIQKCPFMLEPLRKRRRSERRKEVRSTGARWHNLYGMYARVKRVKRATLV
jgi:hypothetical protein